MTAIDRIARRHAALSLQLGADPGFPIKLARGLPVHVVAPCRGLANWCLVRPDGWIPSHGWIPDQHSEFDLSADGAELWRDGTPVHALGTRRDHLAYGRVVVASWLHWIKLGGERHEIDSPAHVPSGYLALWLVHAKGCMLRACADWDEAQLEDACLQLMEMALQIRGA